MVINTLFTCNILNGNRVTAVYDENTFWTGIQVHYYQNIVKYPMNVLQTDTKYTIEIINIKPVVTVGSFSTRTKNARGEKRRNPGKLEKFIDY